MLFTNTSHRLGESKQAMQLENLRGGGQNCEGRHQIDTHVPMLNEAYIVLEQFATMHYGKVSMGSVAFAFR